jgi:hypothetical protein
LHLPLRFAVGSDGTRHDRVVGDDFFVETLPVTADGLGIEPRLVHPVALLSDAERDRLFDQRGEVIIDSESGRPRGPPEERSKAGRTPTVPAA